VRFCLQLMAIATVLLVDASAESFTFSGLAAVIDGDTISIGQQSIRLAAIDACELDQDGLRGNEVWACGIAAWSYLRKIVEGQHVRCKIVDEDHDRRYVGQCFVGNVDVGLAMVQNGLAELRLRYLSRAHIINLLEYERAENQALADKLGIWSAEIENQHIATRAKSSQAP
jgi:endonuclease YncB( thermonuclease family)